MQNLNLDPKNEIIRSILFVMMEVVLSTVTGTPWSYYQAFVIEERHGFNKQTKFTFFTDILKTVALEVVLIPPVLAGIIYLL